MSSKKKISIKSLAVIGMMIAITFILAITPFGLIPLPLASASTIHIPTIIIAILEGPIIGAIVGCALGLITLFRALTAPVGILDPYFVNPIISVLPRIMIGLLSGWFYLGARRMFKKDYISCAISAMIGSIVNTVGVLGLLYLIYMESIAEKIGGAVGPVFLGIIASSGVMEAIAASIITIAIVTALRKVIYK